MKGRPRSRATSSSFEGATTLAAAWPRTTPGARDDRRGGAETSQESKVSRGRADKNRGTGTKSPTNNKQEVIVEEFEKKKHVKRV